MSSDITKDTWDAYCAKELRVLGPILQKLGYVLDTEQPHITGERYLMEAATNGRKLILLGRRMKDGIRVVIKTTPDPEGMRGLEHERDCRRILQKINFAYQIFLSPEELLFVKKGKRLIAIQRFIEQESTFIARPLKEQFALSLKAFKAQEAAHATTYGHKRLISRTFGFMDGRDYLDNFDKFVKNIERELPEESQLQRLLKKAKSFLLDNRETIEKYNGFLTHTDFVPHNFRVKGHDIYLLDHSSLRFGNKYEGWARFVNWMALYNPPLAEALIAYVGLNRTPEESLSLKLMRIYRLGEIIWYYTSTLKKCSGNLHLLNQERVRLWTNVLEAVLNNTEVSMEILDDYRQKRDVLRGEDEKIRQKDLH